MIELLTIAGSDPTGGAGIQRDIETFLELGARPLSVVTTVTAQSPEGVLTARSLPPWLVEAELRAALHGPMPDAIKIGLTGSASVIDAIYGVLKERAPERVVIDPVVRASSGYRFLKRGALSALKRLISLATMVTPNIYEAELLSGVAITDGPSLKEAAQRILSLGCAYVLIKGGHLEGPPVDTLFDRKGHREFSSERLSMDEALLHGTGCILSGAIAFYLAEGRSPSDAVAHAKAYLKRVLKRRARQRSL